MSEFTFATSIAVISFAMSVCDLLAALSDVYAMVLVMSNTKADVSPTWGPRKPTSGNCFRLALNLLPILLAFFSSIIKG